MLPAFLQRWLFLFGQLAHVTVDLGVGDQRVEIGNFGVDCAISLDRRDYGLKLGEFTRQPDVRLGSQIGRQLALYHRVAGK